MTDSSFDLFQVFCMIFFLVGFIGRTLYLRFAKKVNVLPLPLARKAFSKLSSWLFSSGWFCGSLKYSSTH